MIGSVIINGTDIADFGAMIIRGGDNDFLLMPERKVPPQNNWYEYDGLDVDLSEIYFNARNLSVGFYISARSSLEYQYNLNELYKLISAGYIDLYSREFDKTFNLRYINVPEYNHKGGFYKQGAKGGDFTIAFSMDAPTQLFTRPDILTPVSTMRYSPSGILLNDIDLADFGIIVNECYSSMLTLPAVKAPLTRSFAKRSGLLAYPSSTPTFEAKENVIKCTMAAPTRAEFYRNYDALFNNLCKTGEISIESYLGVAACYYMKMEDFKKLGVFSGGVKVSFALRLMQIDAGLTVFVLGTSGRSAILTEDGKYIIEINT